MSDAQITAVIVTYNSGAEIGECLASAAGYGIPAVVVDNGSQDQTLEVVRSSTALLIANGENRGFAAAVNQGCSAARTSLVLLLNPDTVLITDPRELAAEFELDEVGAASGPLVNFDGSPQAGFMVRRFPTALTLAFEVLGLNRIWPSNRINQQWRCMDLDLSQARDVEQPAGAYLMIRRSVWELLGGSTKAFTRCGLKMWISVSGCGRRTIVSVLYPGPWQNTPEHTPSARFQWSSGCFIGMVVYLGTRRNTVAPMRGNCFV